MNPDILRIFGDEAVALSKSKHPVFYMVLRYGLGNKLYQIATALSLAQDHNGSAVFIFPDYPMAGLDEFGGHELINVSDDLPVSLPEIFPKLTFIKEKISLLKLKEFENYYEHMDYRMFEKIPAGNKDMILDGLFFSYSFFGHSLQKIIPYLEPHERIQSYIKTKYEALLKKQCVSVHFRLGKKIGDELFTEQRTSLTWYKRAFSKFPEQTTFVVCADNMDKAKNFLKPIAEKWEFVFIEGEPMYIDLFLMSYCKHNIINASTFSAWSTHLNKNPDKITLCHLNFFEERIGKSAIGPDWIDPEPIWQKIFQPYYLIKRYRDFKEFLKKYAPMRKLVPLKRSLLKLILFFIPRRFLIFLDRM